MIPRVVKSPDFVFNIGMAQITTRKGFAMTDKFVSPFGDRKGKVTPDEIADTLSLEGHTLTAKQVRAKMRRLTDKQAQPGSGGRWAVEIESAFFVRLISELRNPHNRAIVVAELRSDLQ
jgi:hypothetical protein